MDRLNTGVKAAIDKMGGQRALADALGISQPHISDYLHGRYRVPASRAVEIEQLTGVSKVLIRPDVFGQEEA